MKLFIARTFFLLCLFSIGDQRNISSQQDDSFKNYLGCAFQRVSRQIAKKENIMALQQLSQDENFIFMTPVLIKAAFAEIAQSLENSTQDEEHSYLVNNFEKEYKNLLLWLLQKRKLFFLTKIPAITGQDETVGGNLAVWGSATIETGLNVNNNNGGTVFTPAVQIASFTTNPALLITTTAGLTSAQIITDVTQPALSIASATGIVATAPVGSRLLVNGPCVYSASSGITLTVTGNASNTTILAIGNGATTGPALELINNPPSAITDFNLTIDSQGIVHQSSSTLQNQFILNGGQQGPLTIGTTNATSLSMGTAGVNTLAFDQFGSTVITGNVGVGPLVAPITQLQIYQPNPLLAGAATTGASSGPSSVYVQGRYAYVVNNTSNTFQIFDVSNSPAAPVLLKTVTGVTAPNIVYAQGNYAYIGNNAGALQVFDISNIANPVSLVTVTAGAGPMALYVQGRFAYLGNFTANTLQVFDVSNPASPLLVNTQTGLSGPSSIYVQGRYCYVTNFTSGTLQVFDVTNPTAPTVAATQSGLTSPTSVYVQGRYAYVTTSTTLQVYDISNPNTPSLVGTASGLTTPSGVYVQGNYAYVINSVGNTLQVFDVSNPASPIAVGSSAAGLNNPSSLYIQGRFAYVTNMTGNTLQVVNLAGAYIQQLEAGGIEVGTLQTRENVTVNNDADFKGGVTIGRSLNVTGNIGIFAGDRQSAIAASNGSASAPSYSFINTNTSTGMYSPGTNQLALSTYGQARLNIDLTGSVTEKSNYKVQVYRSGTTQSIANTTAAIIFNTKVLDPNNNFNTTTGTYTVPVSGTYLITATVGFTIASATTSADVVATHTLSIAIGGVAQLPYTNTMTPGFSIGGLGATAGTTGPYFITTTALVPLTAGQLVTLTYNTTRTDTININTTTCAIHYLSF